jgi:hypothetical protein
MDQDGKCQCKTGAHEFSHSVINYHFLQTKWVYFNLVAIVGSNHQQTNQVSCINVVHLFQMVDLLPFIILDFFVRYVVVALMIDSIVALFLLD